MWSGGKHIDERAEERERGGERHWGRDREGELYIASAGFKVTFRGAN